MFLRHLFLILFSLLAFRQALSGEASFSTPIPSSGAPAQKGWSAGLLEAFESPGSTTRKGGGSKAGEGFILRTYQLQHVRLGEAGRSQVVLQVLRRLLPQGSALKEDIQSNSVHVLSSATAQAAVWDLLSAVDVAEVFAESGSLVLPPSITAALEKMEAMASSQEKLTENLGRVRQELGQELGAAEAARRRDIKLYGGLLLVCLATLSLVGVWLLSRGKRNLDLQTEVRMGEGGTLAVHQALQSPLLKEDKELQREVLSVLNTAAIRMEAWYEEQKAHGEQLARTVARQEALLTGVQHSMEQARSQLISENRQLLVEAGTRFEQSAGRLEAGVQELGGQNRRVEALAKELQSTVHELDSARDRLSGLELQLRDRNHELDTTREGLFRREAELVRQQAKLAALTLVLEEGSWPDGAGIPQSAGFDSPGVALEGTQTEDAPGTEQGDGRELRHFTNRNSVPGFVFLAPDHPETTERQDRAAFASAP